MTGPHGGDLEVEYLTGTERAALPRAGRHVLADFSFHAPDAPSAGAGPGLTIDVPLEPLAAAGPRLEVARWTTDAPPRRFSAAGFECAATDELLVGWSAVDATDAERAGREVYERLLTLLAGRDDGHLLRIWNVVPHIHAGDPQPDGATLERYQAFCRGRAEAFEAALGQGFEGALPAASAVGSHGGRLVVAFLAGRAAPTHHENPRQVAAWRYPARYGPRSPSFARATTTPYHGADLLLSGTASVVGHETAHAGDVAAQTAETLRNLDVLCAADGVRPPHAPRVLRAFIREQGDARAVERALRAHYGPDVPLLLLHADICRRDLLVEVEGVGLPRPMPTMQSEPSLCYDAVVIGGAFAGASTALLLRRLRPDARVLVIERQREFDRKVGEATVEVSSHFLMEVLQLGDHLVREHLPKHGLVYYFHKDGDETFAEMSEVGASPVPALQSFLLDRSKIDEQLLALAEEAGADVWRPARVVEATPGAPSGRVVVEKDGETFTIEARWIVDASGRRRWLGQQLGLHREIEALPTNAMWGRWRGVKDIDGAEVLGGDPRRPAIPRTPRRRALCTNHFMAEGSWTWLIPLPNGEMSVGLVFDPRHYEPPKEGRAKETYVAFVRSRPGVRELLRDAELIEGDFRSYRHLPYTTERYMGPGYALVGDAASFLDPYYSPGLDHVSMSVYATVRIIEEDLGGALTETELAAAIDLHNDRFRRSIDRWFNALYRDKYEIFGDAELAGAAFYLDTALYYLGVVGPILRDVDTMRIPTLGLELPQATAAYRFLNFYRGRLTTLARKRRARGVYGRKNRGWRSLSGTFGTAKTRSIPAPFWRGMRLWLGAELMELNPFRRRRPRSEAAPALRTAEERA